MNTTFTTYAEKKAKQFLNLLQGYTKGIRLTAILILLLMGVSNAWAGDSEYGNNKIIYLDITNASTSDGWRVDQNSLSYKIKMYYNDSDNSNEVIGEYCCTRIGTSSVYYTTTNNGYVRHVQALRCKGNCGEQYNYSNRTSCSSRSYNHDNCIILPKDNSNWWNQWTPTWTCYVPGIASALINNTSTVYGGDGTEANPYQILVSSTLSVNASATSIVPEDNAPSKEYQFSLSTNSGTRTTKKNFSNSDSYSFTASATAGTKYAIDVEARNNNNSNIGQQTATSTLYYVTISPVYAILGSFNGWTHSANTWDLSDQGSNNWKATFHLEQGNHTFKVVHNSSYYGKTSTTITRSSATTSSLSTSGDNINLTADYAGNYTFTFNSSTKNLTVTYPTIYKVTYSHYPAAAADAPTTSPSVTSGNSVVDGTSVKFTAKDAKTGYTWKGWYSNNAGSGTALSDNQAYTTSITANTTIYAVYTLNTYTITYKDQGDANFSGTHADGHPTTHTYGTATTLKGATKTGYTLSGWFDNKECTGTAIESLGATAYTANITLYAKWTPNTYTITYKDQGDANFSGTHADGHPTTHTYGTETTLKDASKTSYNFDGWHTDQECTQKVTLLGATAYTDNITLYAKWTPVPTLEISTNQQYLRAGKDKLQLSITYANIPAGHYYRVKVGPGYWNGNEEGANVDRVAIIPGDGSVTFKSNQPLGLGEQTIIVELWKDGPTGTSSNEVKVTVEQDHQVAVYAYLDGVKSEAGGSVTSATPIFPTEHIEETITASQPNPGYSFVNWTASNGNIKFTDPNSLSTTVTAIGGGDIHANYTKMYDVQVSVAAGQESWGSVSPTSTSVGSVSAQQITATANTDLGYEFDHWKLSDGITITSGNANSATIQVKATKAGSLTAHFRGENRLQNVYLIGTMNNNKESDANWQFYKLPGESGNTVTLTKTINKSDFHSVGYKFGIKIFHSDWNSKYWKNSSEGAYKMDAHNCANGWGFNTDGGNFNTFIDLNVSGEYTFTLTDAHASDKQKLSITYPDKSFIEGNFATAWDENAYPLTENGDIQTVTIPITSKEDVEFRLVSHGKLFGSNTKILVGSNSKELSPKNMEDQGAVMTIGAYVEGDYTFSYNKSTKVLTVTWPVINQLQVYRANPEHTEATKNWNWDTHNGDEYSKTLSLNANTKYEFKAVLNSDFYGKTTTLTRETPSETLNTSGGDVTLQTDIAGDYTFTFNTSTKALSLTYPVAYTFTYGIGTNSKGLGTVAVTPDIASGDLVAAGTDFELSATPNLGYKFVGWYREADCTNQVSTANPYNFPINSTTTLYAKFEKRDLYIHTDIIGWGTTAKMTQDDTNKAVYTYTIKGLAQNATNGADYNTGYHFRFTTKEPSELVYNWNDVQEPKYEGSSIDGVHLTDQGNPTIQFGLTRKSDITITLTLQSAIEDPNNQNTWPTVRIEAIPYYNITLDQANATSQSNPTSVEVKWNEAMPKLTTTPNRTGYNFGGYYADLSDENTKYYNADGTSAKAWDINDDKTLNAKWTAIPYEITYELNGGTNHANNPSTYTVENETITLQDATKDGFNFCGWFSDETFTTQVTEIANGSTEDITLYARWGNTFDHPHIYLNNANLQWDEAMILIGHEKNSEGYNQSANPVPNTQLVYFHPEVEWLDQTRFSILKAKDWEFNNEAFDTRINYLNDHIGVQQNYNFRSGYTYYVTGSVPSTINLQEAKYDNAVDYPSLPFFNAIQSVKVRDAKNGAYTVADGEWPATLSLTGTNMGANGGWNNTERNTITSSSSNDPEEAHRKYVAVVTGLITQTFSNLKEDYIFEGWGTGDSPSSTADTYEYHITENTTVYAFFTKIYRTVIMLDQEGAAQKGTTSVTATYGEDMPEATMPTAADGYDFNGYYDAVGTQYYNARGASARAWDKKDTECTLYPYWSPIEYTITYHLNDGSGTMTPTTYTVESETFELPTPTKTGYTFAGWYENVELTGNAVDQIEKGSTTGNKEYWAKWNVASYTITFEAEGGSGGPSTLTVPFGNQLPDITIPTNAGHLFLGYYDGTGTQYYDANGKGLKKMPANNITLYAKWLSSSDCIFFYNNLGWTNVYVYFYSSDKYWDDSKGTGSKNDQTFPQDGDAEHKPHYYGYRGKMTKIEGTSIWYYNRSVHSEIRRDNYTTVAFTKDEQYNYEFFYETEVVRRGDFNSNVPMFVSMKADGARKNESTYYNNGYWMNYPTNTGYKLHIFDENGNKINDQLVDIPFEYGDNMIMPWSVNVSLEGAMTYAFKIQRADGTNDGNGTWYGNNGTMTTNSSGDVGQTAWEFTTGTDNCKITTTASGTYVFTLKYDKDAHSNYNYLVGVEYPASVGDYRLAYKDNAHPFHPGHLLKKRDGKDTVSFFVHHDESPIIMLQQIINIDANTGEITWETRKTYALTANQAGGEDPGQAMMRSRRNADEVILQIGGGSLDGVDLTGIYNFVLEQDDDAANLLNSVTKYDGDFYIRTNYAAGGWGNFRQAGNKMTYSSYAENHSDFNHYFVEWIEAETGGNVKFTIANDYSYCISDTLDADNIIQKNDVSPGCLPADANVRFGWDSRNNKLTRAYIAGSGFVGDRFLVVTGNELLKDAEGKTLTAGPQGDTDKDKEDSRYKLNANEDIFKDLGNWVYQVDVTAQNGTMINLTALYNGTIQYFKGAEGEPSYPLLASTNVGKEYKIRMIYNFKTNHLVVAWMPESPYDVQEPEQLGTDMLLIRRNQEQATQIQLNSGAGTINNIKTAYAVMTFTEEFVGDETKPIHERKHYWVSFPFDVKISDVFGFSEYKDHWIMQAYDGAGRAANGLWADTDTYWRYITNNNFVMRKGQGYLLTLDVKKMLELDPVFANTEEVSLYFPSRGELDTITSYLPTAATVPAHTCTIERENRKIYDSHWNMIGVPGFADIANFNTDAPDKYLQESELEYQGDSLSFYYAYIPAENSYEVQTGETTFQSMYSYMVQFAGTINWTTPEVVYNPQLVARRNSDSNEPEKLTMRLEIAQGEEMADQTFVQLQQEGATPEFDMNLDLTKIINSGANIYTLVGNSRIQTAGNALPMDEAMVVPVGVKIDAEGEYTFRMPDGTEGMVVELVDYETYNRTNLLLTDYTVTLPKGTNENRFVLHIQPQKDIVTGVENFDEGVNNGEAVKKFLIDGKLIIRTAEGVFDAQGKRL